MDIKKNLLFLMIGSLATAALISIIIIIFGSFGEVEVKILSTVLSIGIYSMTGYCSATQYNSSYKNLSISGMITSALTFTFSLLIIYELFSLNTEFVWKLISLLTIVSFTLGSVCLIYLIDNTEKLVKISQKTTVICTYIVASMISVLIIFPDFILTHLSFSEFYFRLLLAISVITALGMLVTPILNKVYKNQKI